MIGCNKPHDSFGFCKSHYSFWRYHHDAEYRERVLFFSNQWKKNNYERWKAKTGEWRKKNSGRIRANAERWRKENPERVMHYRAKADIRHGRRRVPVDRMPDNARMRHSMHEREMRKWVMHYMGKIRLM